MKKPLVILLILTGQLTALSQWKFQSSGTNEMLLSVYFTNDNTGYAVGNGGVILKTYDGGSHWSKTIEGSTDNLISVCFSDAKNGYILGNDYWGTNFIMITTNGGSTWAKTYFENSNGLRNIQFPTKDTGYIVGYAGVIYKTTDGGENWSHHYVGPSYHLWSLYFVNANIGYAVGEKNILKTTDGASTWQHQVSGATDFLYSVYFLNADTGYVCGSANILKTTNGGADWIKLPATYSHFSIFFTDTDTGYVGGFQSIMKTTDGGTTWKQQLAFPFCIRSIYFSDSDVGCAVGDSGFIYRTTTGGELGFNEDPWPSLPISIYPNPATGQFNLTFTLDSPSKVNLDVFNNLGEVVTQILDEEMSRGEHRVIWNATGMPPGIYFYKLKADNVSSTGKMVVVR